MTSSWAARPIGEPRQRDDAVAQSLAHCHRITRREARNFYYGMKLTPEPKRSAMYAIYAWMRMADDLADEPGAYDDKVKRIEAFRADTHAALDVHAPLPNGLMWPAVRKALNDFRIPVEYLDAMIEGQLLDQQQVRYETFEQLHDYCYKVASVVGLVCIEVWGYRGGEATRQMAIDRGVALQLTNILRDLAEDAARDRIYLPADELAAFDIKPSDLARRRPSTAFDRLMAFQVERARRYYEQSDALEASLDTHCRATSWAMMRIYRQLLEKIARDPRQALRRRVKLNKLQKVFIGMRATVGV